MISSDELRYYDTFERDDHIIESKCLHFLRTINDKPEVRILSESRPEVVRQDPCIFLLECASIIYVKLTVFLLTAMRVPAMIDG